MESQQNRIRAWLIVGLVLMSGCVSTRDPQPVSLVQAQDDAQSCDELKVEYVSNTSVASKKIAKNDADDVQDVALGLLIWPGLADFKNADGTEGNALLDRNVRLLELARTRGCELGGLPAQPERYD